MKRIYFGKDARERVLEGMKVSYEAVSVTYGPLGGDVLIGSKYGAPTMTHDGDTVAGALYDLEDDESTYGRTEGIELVKGAADKLNKEVGDATTTASVLTYHLSKNATEYLNAGINPQKLKKMIQVAGNEAIDILKTMGEKIDTKSQRAVEIATISAKDPIIGKIVGDTFRKIGGDGFVSVVEGRGTETTTEFINGFKIDKGYYSSLFVNDDKANRAVLSDVAIVLIEDKVEDKDILNTFIGKLFSAGMTSILFIVDELEPAVLGEIVSHKLEGARISAIKPPSFGTVRSDKMQDLSILTGGRVIAEKYGLKLENADVSDVGKVKSVIVGQESTTIIGGKPVSSRISELKNQKTGKPDSEVAILDERIASLKGAAAVITVGGNSPVEIEKLHFDIDDAVAATKAAFAEGIVAGGGVTLRDVSLSLQGTGPGYDIVRNALLEPFNKIMSNAGVDNYDVNLIQKGKGINVMADDVEVTDMKSHGIIDPLKATRLALVSALSIATNYTGMGELIVDVPDKEK